MDSPAGPQPAPADDEALKLYLDQLNESIDGDDKLYVNVVQQLSRQGVKKVIILNDVKLKNIETIKFNGETYTISKEV